MTLKKSITFIAFTVSISANAALYDRGDGMIYDDVLDITWLQDANYALTSGYDTNGLMTWTETNEWVNNLVYGGFDDWRLPSVNTLLTDAANSPETAYGFTSGELGYMYYINLENCLCPTIAGSFSFIDGVSGELMSFLNVPSQGHWYGDEENWGIFYLAPYTGAQLEIASSAGLAGWAVRDGDVAAVPVPATAWLFGSALIGFMGFKRKINN